MYKRNIEDYLSEVESKYSVITVIGPRQSGKSTLCRQFFSEYEYINLEESDTREFASADPRGFFRKHASNLILDEIQKASSLLSYIQTIVDDRENNRRFVLTGSQNLSLMEKVTQSLAGRTVIAKLLPFSRKEIWSKPAQMTIDELMFAGGYPRIYDKSLNPNQWLQQYYQTYIERDVRNLINITQLDLFERFIRLCAGRAGQLLNLSSIAADCGITQPTARAWLSALKASFICFTLQPHFKNFNKRIIKTPKVYFYDTGLLSYLLRIQNAETLSAHPLRGNIFENWVVSETIKTYYNRGLEAPVYFWRDTKGNEIDLIIDEGNYLYPIEIKSAFTPNINFLRNVEYFIKTQAVKRDKKPYGECVYCGDSEMEYKDLLIKPWTQI
ncbi:MAG: ATP-binding protein [Candidatus Margulisiibacteriota bacterium]